MKHTTWIGAGHALLLLTGPVGAASVPGKLAPENVQFMTVTVSNVPTFQGMHWQVEWPSTNEIRATLATNDISERTNPPPPKTVEEDRKPTELPTKAPSTVVRQVIRGLPFLLREEWIPDNVSEYMLTLRKPDLSESRLLVRYVVQGQSIQIIMKRAYMCVTILPDIRTLKGSETSTLSERVFRTFFQHGEEMAALSYATNAVGNCTMGVPSRNYLYSDGWRSSAWLSDGKGIAILIPRRSHSQQRVWQADEKEPWF